MSTIDTGNYTIGGVDLYYDPTVAHASLDLGATLGPGYVFRTAGRNLGNIVTAEFAPEITYLDHTYIDADGKIKLDHKIVQSEMLSIPFTFDEMNEANIRKFFMGDSVTTASLVSIAEPAFRVMENALEYGSVQIYFRTDIGTDMIYMAPKVMIRPNGNLSMNTESWWEGPLILDVFPYTWTPTNVATSGATIGNCPYGIMTFGGIS